MWWQAVECLRHSDGRSPSTEASCGETYYAVDNFGSVHTSGNMRRTEMGAFPPPLPVSRYVRIVKGSSICLHRLQVKLLYQLHGGSNV